MDAAERQLPLVQPKRPRKWKDDTLSCLCAESRVAHSAWKQASCPRGKYFDASAKQPPMQVNMVSLSKGLKRSASGISAGESVTSTTLSVAISSRCFLRTLWSTYLIQNSAYSSGSPVFN